MRKKTIHNLADTIFWYLLYFLPVICYLLYMIAEPNTSTNIVNFSEFFSSIGLGIVQNNIVVSTLQAIFGVEGILPLFNTQAPFIIFGWFVSCYIIHLAVDFLIFLPRLAHNFMDKYTNKVVE